MARTILIWLRTILIWLVLFLVLGLILAMFGGIGVYEVILMAVVTAPLAWWIVNRRTARR